MIIIPIGISHAPGVLQTVASGLREATKRGWVHVREEPMLRRPQGVDNLILKRDERDQAPDHKDGDDERHCAEGVSAARRRREGVRTEVARLPEPLIVEVLLHRSPEVARTRLCGEHLDLRGGRAWCAVHRPAVVGSDATLFVSAI